MFTGIIEATGQVVGLKKENQNLHLHIQCIFSQELKVDQSLAHNGVCLTVTECDSESYKVTAIHETLEKTNFDQIALGDIINLERCMTFNGRLDGHIVQGHVDTTARLLSIEDEQGSWRLRFEHANNPMFITVEKGSICVNGISLTVVNSTSTTFEVAIIPYTWEHTNLKNLKIGNQVNLEFDILGKYVAKLMSR
jgi:riboflavin synthase